MITTNRILAEKHVIPLIGKTNLKDLSADDVDDWLDGLTEVLSTRSLQGVHSILKRAVRQAQARDEIVPNWSLRPRAGADVRARRSPSTKP
ncbi:hypothetical protein [Actinomadura rugatobispora]|uniref:Core-binding (CB) domain-containing protein n=1 Tax=Actinomadura rugatobispora TaxID=1994 RepID=A0ABW0ZS06_9ACTN|nr:hypothetical protein GCM10010200_001880 [Actinomadura rugatobispora]